VWLPHLQFKSLVHTYMAMGEWVGGKVSGEVFVWVVNEVIKSDFACSCSLSRSDIV